MSLLVYNLTAAPLVLANGLSTTIPASTAGAGVRGRPWYASGNELNGRSGAEYLALQAQQTSNLVAFEWEQSPDYPTPGLQVAISSTVAEALTKRGQVGAQATGIELNIYIDGALGDDTNTGLAAGAGNALKTVEGFYAKFPLLTYNGYRLIVNFASNGALQQLYTTGLLHIGYGGDGQLPAIRYRGPEMVLAVLATGVNSFTGATAAATNLTADGVATPLRTTITFAGGGWTANDMAGRYFLRVKSVGGQRRYFEIPISGNTATTLDVDTGGVVASGMVAGIAIDDVLEIVRPGASFAASVASGNPNGTAGIRITGDNVHVETVASDLVGAIFERMAFASGVLARATSRSSYDRCSQTGGLWTIQGGSGSFVNCAARHANNVNQNVHFVTWDGSARTMVSRPSGGLIVATDVPTDKVPSVCIAMFNSFLNIGARTSPEALQQDGLELHGQGQFNAGLAITIKNPPNLAGVTGAVMVQGQKAMLFMGRVGTSPSYRPAPLIIEGLAATKVGIHCRLGGQARINPSVTSIDQTNHLKCSAIGSATVNLGTGVGEFNEAAGFNGDFSRLAPGVVTPNNDTARIFKVYE